MKRQLFLRSCLAAAAVLATPFSLLAKTIRKYREDKGFLVTAGASRSGKAISVMEGDIFTTKVMQKTPTAMSTSLNQFV